MTDGFSELAKDSLAYIKLLEDGIEQWEYVAASLGAVEDIARENAQMDAEIYRQREKIRVLELSLQAVNDGNASLQRENLMLESRLSHWISVEERLPKVKGSYLVCGKHWIARSEPITTIHYWWGDSWAQSTVFEITHWMPLPEPPKEEHK